MITQDSDGALCKVCTAWPSVRLAEALASYACPLPLMAACAWPGPQPPRRLLVHREITAYPHQLSD